MSRENTWDWFIYLHLLLILYGISCKKSIPPRNEHLAPENGWLEDEISFWDEISSQGLYMYIMWYIYIYPILVINSLWNPKYDVYKYTLED